MSVKFNSDMKDLEANSVYGGNSFCLQFNDLMLYKEYRKLSRKCF